MDQNSEKPSNGFFAKRSNLLAALFVIACAVLRFAHHDLVWIEEAYPLAAASEVLRGKALYRDIWFDKPPLYALVYLLWGAAAGIPLRIAGVVFVCGFCWIAWRFARDLGGDLAGPLAACLSAVALTFDIPSAVLALAPDLLLAPVHLAAVYLAWRGRAFWSGLAAGVALLFNSKAIFVAAVCLLWTPRFSFAAGFLIPNLVAVGWMVAGGELVDYWQQVWVWGAKYSRDTFVIQPFREGLIRSANWLGFHAAAAVGTIYFIWKRPAWRMALWIAISFFAVWAGLRFFPRYYFQLMPAIVICGAAGLAMMPARYRVLTLCLLLIPIGRFGPRYAQLSAGDRNWSDLALMKDSRDAARIAKSVARPGDGLLVWGYRPDVFVFSGLPAATAYLDSQPLTGVLADRHLISSKSSAGEMTSGNLAQVARRHPEIIVDGLGALNPNLAVTRYLPIDGRYELAGRTAMSIIYVTKR